MPAGASADELITTAREHLSAVQGGKGRERVRAAIDCLAGIADGDRSRWPDEASEIYEALVDWIARDAQMLEAEGWMDQNMLELRGALTDMDSLVNKWQEGRLQRKGKR